MIQTQSKEKDRGQIMKKILSVLLIVAAVMTQVAAAGDFSYDIGNGQVTVTGSKTGYVNIYLVKDDAAQSDLSDSNPPVYARQITAQGDYSYVMSLSDNMVNGKYNLYIDGEQCGSFEYYNIPRANTYLNTYVHNVCTSAAELKTALENSGDNLGIIDGERPYLGSIAEYLWTNGTKINEKISFADPDTADTGASFLYYYSLYKEIAVKCMMMGKSSSEVDALITANSKYLGINDFETEYNNALTASEKTRACEILSKTDLRDNKFDEHLRDAKIIAKCAMAQHASNLKSVIETNKLTIGITLTSSDSAVYSRMMDSCSGFYEFQDIIDAYNIAANYKPAENTGSTGGGGGGAPIKVYAQQGETPDKANPDENPSVQAPTGKFGDMSGFEWADKAITEMVERKILSGYDDGSFRPGNKVNRAEFSKIIAVTLGLKAEASSFSDISNDSWYAGFVGAMEKNDYIAGFEGAFLPENELTRQDAAVILARIMEKKGIELTVLKKFDDSEQIVDYAKTAVEALAAAGIINGKGDNKFYPNDALSRAEAAVLIYNALINTAD